MGVQGLRHRVHAGDADRHLHGLPGGRLRRLLQLRAGEPPAGSRGRAGGTAMTPGSGGRAELPVVDREQRVLDRIDRARRRRPRVREERITMSHGSGGKATQTLIEAVFLEAFRNPELERLEDSAELQLAGRLALTTD